MLHILRPLAYVIVVVSIVASLAVIILHIRVPFDEIIGWVTVLTIAIILILVDRDKMVQNYRGRWVRTGERFIDPTTHRWTVIEYNAETGQRRYVDEE